MENLLDRITIDPEICNGKPIIKGQRITVKTILEYLAAGEAIENILAAYPTINKEDIYACIQFASAAIDHNFTIYKLAS